jgi:hypothetical protein
VYKATTGIINGSRSTANFGIFNVDAGFCNRSSPPL